MSVELKDRHVVVTGGAGALGQAVTGLLLQVGASCSVPCYSKKEMDEAPFDRGEHVFMEAGVDLADEKQAGHFYAEAVDRLGPLWASVHLAGGFGMGNIENTGAEAFRGQWSLNTLTCYNSCRAAVRHMRQTGEGGRIVNVASRPALEPRQGKGMPAYTAAKAAVAALTQALGAELAGDGILVNAVAPSVIDTPQNRTDMPEADYETWPKPREIARQILWLASPNNRVTRGAVVPVYGKS
ncbi:MAG: SDR family NAD(P)-dependent oxidoreductase [Balneolaceae bacterium]|nr:SDR family NAD(P)-dependent oxidoreductase [Balneolaceae bacterium]